MSVNLKCDRCGAVKPMTQPADAIASFAQALRNQQTPATWATVMVSKNNVSARTYHLCSDCRGWLEDFMKGEETPAIPLPSAIVLQHPPAPDCHLIWDPTLKGAGGGYICSHDEPDRFHFLAGQAASQQSVARAVAQSDWNEALGRVKPASASDLVFEKVHDPSFCSCEHQSDQHGRFGCGYLGGCPCKWDVINAHDAGRAEIEDADEIPDEEPMCAKCTHAVHRRDNCGAVIKTKKAGGTMLCPCSGGMSDAVVPEQRKPEKS